MLAYVREALGAPWRNHVTDGMMLQPSWSVVVGGAVVCSLLRSLCGAALCEVSVVKLRERSQEPSLLGFGFCSDVDAFSQVALCPTERGFGRARYRDDSLLL